MASNALLYDRLEDDVVQCNLCAHRCRIRDGGRGICRVRENRDGSLYTLVYGNLIAENVDPIEKKPLYHFLPGTLAYSIATPGCNFRCEWCQNWQISQMPRQMEMPEGRRRMPERSVKEALRTDSRSIAYTYTEPTIFFEYTYDTAKLAKEAGLRNVYVTNGFMTREMIELIKPYLDAANVDIKAFKDETYRTLMDGKLEPVLDSCKTIKEMGIWLEITTLIVPGVNDDPDELKSLAGFIFEELGPETPWHLSRFYPQYKMKDRDVTEEAILYDTKAMAEELGLNYVYIGNLFGPSNTYCKQCGKELISRSGYAIRVVGLDKEGRCVKCKTILDGVGLGN